jgi:predicted RND superfamily exporter protein
MITTYAPGIIITILLISMGFALVIPNIEFKTNLNRFLPDNELVRANDRVGDYFGNDLTVHVIHVQEDNSAHDVLMPDALREQFDIFQRVKNKANVVEVVSVVSLMDEIFEKIFPMYNSKEYPGFEKLSDSELEEGKAQIFKILNGSWDISIINLYLNLTPPISLKDLQQFIDIFFDKSFNYNSRNPSAKSTLVIIFINGSLGESLLKEISKDIRSTISTEDYDQIILSHTGSHLIAADLDDVSSESFTILGIAIIVLITVILSLSFRRISYVLLPLLTLGLAVVWTFGTMILLDIEFTVIMVAVIPLIIGLGVDYSVYISKRYQEELRKGNDISEAIIQSVGSVGTAMFLAVITTIIAFMSNLISNIAPIRDFGLICGIGISYAFILTITFHTSVRWLIDIKSDKKPLIGKEKELFVVDLGTSTASQSVIYYPILVLIIVMILTLGAFTFALNLRTEFNDKDFLPNDWESLQTQQELEESFNASSFTQAYILLEDELKESELTQDNNNIATITTLLDIQKIEENIANDKHVVRIEGVARTESVVYHVINAIKDNRTLANIVDRDNDLFPDNDTGVEKVFNYLFENRNGGGSGFSLLDNNLMHFDISSILYRTSNGHYKSTLIRVYVDVEDSSEVRKMYSELKADVSGVELSGIEKSVTGNVILTVTTMDSLQESQINTTIIAIIFALLILIIIYRRPTLGLIAITPVLISSVWILGTMYFFSISINVFTVSITALTIGLGIDYAIHIIERYREEIRNYDSRSAIRRTIRNTGAALFISALTTVCGFFVLIISPIPPIQHFGLITAMTIVYSSILALVVIPILLMKWNGKNQ